MLTADQHGVSFRHRPEEDRTVVRHYLQALVLRLQTPKGVVCEHLTRVPFVMAIGAQTLTLPPPSVQTRGAGDLSHPLSHTQLSRPAGIGLVHLSCGARTNVTAVNCACFRWPC
jgi:hypothetical protein